ncbi:restriction endonuclease subunit S [Peptoniphilus duerdenii]|uniref:restriction endonuclease subunit S n=1 Tax=Peptoniphilus duerdenii TaxID=507750 RepID=UPI002889F64B|nr:restriction endonuclease subunit S [Peptoniphilus duerdenii]
MTPQELKNSILQRAIEGRLVEQRAEEGTGAELFDKIQKEKKELIREGKIKKQKSLEEIKKDEIPFDIPETWKWVRLGEIVFNHGQEKPSVTFSYIDIGSIDNRRQKLNSEENILKSEDAPSRARKIVKRGDVIYSTVRPYLHNICIIDKEFSFKPIASTGFAVMSCYSGLYNRFLFYYLLSPSFDSYANNNENSKGVAYPAINDKQLYKALLPLPPLAEQKRIVEKIEELMPLVDEYEENWQKLEEFNQRFPEDMKKSLLQEAIKGKLVEQRKEEGTGTELFGKIQKEKKELIKEGKIKKQKLLPKITEDEIPFDIPETWKWVRLGEIIDFKMGKTPPRAELQWWKPQVPWVSIADMEEDGFITDTKEGISNEALEKKFSNSISRKGTLLMSFKLTVGRVSILGIDAVHNEAIISIYPIVDSEDIFKSFLFKILPFITKFGETKNAIKGKTLNSTSINNLILPLPPLAEQKRIVDRLEELLPLCDKLIKNKEK